MWIGSTLTPDNCFFHDLSHCRWCPSQVQEHQDVFPPAKKIQKAPSGSEATPRNKWHLYDTAVFLSDTVAVTETKSAWENIETVKKKKKKKIW